MKETSASKLKIFHESYGTFNTFTKGPKLNVGTSKLLKPRVFSSLCDRLFRKLNYRAIVFCYKWVENEEMIDPSICEGIAILSDLVKFYEFLKKRTGII